MRHLTLALIVAVSMIFGFNSVKASDLPVNSTETSHSAGYIMIKQYEDGAIWVYVYSEDGAFVAKYMEQD